MAHLPDWVVEKLRISNQTRIMLGEPGLDEDVVETYIVQLTCPDPDCGEPFQVPRHELPDRYTVPGHMAPATWSTPYRTRCWMSGLFAGDAQSIIALREENGGRLKRAAHP